MKKIVYTAPLKALASEKMRDWSKLFPDKKILQLTGDILTSQQIRKQIIEECCTADILIMTVELLDSITRNHVAEQYAWVKDVELLIADEAHGISMKDRGHTVEASIMRFCQIAPRAKIWFLSATLPNTEEFARWLTTLNHKETEIVNSTWRPTELHWHFIQHSIWGTYSENEYDKIRKAVEIVLDHQNESTLVFVHAKTTGRRVEAALKEAGIECEFYNADLELETRQDLLERFESKGDDRLPVLISTSSLAWGDLAESTLIDMADNSWKCLKDIEVGDWVVSWNSEIETFTVNQVLQKMEYHPRFELEIELEDGTVIKCGPNHQFYVEDPLYPEEFALVKASELTMEHDLVISNRYRQRHNLLSPKLKELRDIFDYKG